MRNIFRDSVGDSDDTGVDWISGRIYTITYELDLVANIITTTVMDGTLASTIWTHSGPIAETDNIMGTVYRNPTTFRLEFGGVTPSDLKQTFVDNITITGAQEPSISITRDPDPQEMLISFIGITVVLPLHSS